MTTTIPVRHPGEDNPDFQSAWACPYCGTAGLTCRDPGCVSWDIEFDQIQDRNEDV